MQQKLGKQNSLTDNVTNIKNILINIPKIFNIELKYFMSADYSILHENISGLSKLIPNHLIFLFGVIRL